MENKNKQITSNVYGRDKWIEIRSDLNEPYEFSPNWQIAIEIFSRRLRRYYINPINKLKDGITGEGFIIVTSQCALIETFAAWKRGKIYNRDVEEDEIYYKNSKDLFVEFLNTELTFEGIFHNGVNPNCPHSAEQFYSKVRCGLMHETKTKDEWIIHQDEENYAKKNPKFKKTGKFIKENKQHQKIIFRNQLQKTLENYFEQYKKDLKNSDKSQNNLRRLFARKLDHLYLNKEEIEKDKPKWWGK